MLVRLSPLRDTMSDEGLHQRQFGTASLRWQEVSPPIFVRKMPKSSCHERLGVKF